MGRIIGIAFMALCLGVVVALALFPDFRARLRQTNPSAQKQGPANPALIGATGFLGFLREGDAYVHDVAHGSTLRATKSGGVSQVRVAPGGNFVSFARGGKLFVAKSDGTAEFPMRDGDRPETARWGSYNAVLVYASASGALVVFDPRAGPMGQRVIDPAGSGVGPRLAWSASGTKIAYERRKPVGSTATRDGIWIVNTALGTPVSTPVYLSSGTNGLRLCCWSSNDQYVMFWQVPLDDEGPERPGRLLVASSAGSEPIEVSAATLLVRGIVGFGSLAPVVPILDGGSSRWSDGKTMTSTEITTAPAGNLIVRRMVLEAVRPVASPSSPAVSLDGTQVAYSFGLTRETDADPTWAYLRRRIGVIGIDGKRNRSLLAEATVPQAVSDDVPKWSRDGRTIVFARRLTPSTLAGSGARAGQLEVWVAYSDGSNARRLIGSLEDPGIPAVGPIDFGTAFDFQP